MYLPGDYRTKYSLRGQPHYGLNSAGGDFYAGGSISRHRRYDQVTITNM